MFVKMRISWLKFEIMIFECFPDAISGDFFG